MEPDRRENVEADVNEAAEEFDAAETAVTERRDLTQDVKKKLKYKEAVRKFLEKRMPPDEE